MRAGFSTVLPRVSAAWRRQENANVAHHTLCRGQGADKGDGQYDIEVSGTPALVLSQINYPLQSLPRQPRSAQSPADSRGYTLVTKEPRLDFVNPNHRQPQQERRPGWSYLRRRLGFRQRSQFLR